MMMTNPAEERLQIALDALASIEAPARANAEYFQRVARIARTALDNIRSHREAENSPEEPESIHRDSEGLGAG
jgi:hypothetical protein